MPANDNNEIHSFTGLTWAPWNFYVGWTKADMPWEAIYWLGPIGFAFRVNSPKLTKVDE